MGEGIPCAGQYLDSALCRTRDNTENINRYKTFITTTQDKNRK